MRILQFFFECRNNCFDIIALLTIANLVWLNDSYLYLLLIIPSVMISVYFESKLYGDE
jgi:hypothetical protein